MLAAVLANLLAYPLLALFAAAIALFWLSSLFLATSLCLWIGHKVGWEHRDDVQTIIRWRTVEKLVTREEKEAAQAGKDDYYGDGFEAPENPEGYKYEGSGG